MPVLELTDKRLLCAKYGVFLLLCRTAGITTACRSKFATPIVINAHHFNKLTIPFYVTTPTSHCRRVCEYVVAIKTKRGRSLARSFVLFDVKCRTLEIG